MDLRAGMADGFPESQYGLILPTAVCGDVVVAGSLVSDGEPRGPSGDVRGFDARSGKDALALPHSTASGRTRE